jgi:glycosyltransferase involved in cell wall biosynthesis
MWGNPTNIKAKETILAIHGDYSNLKIDHDIPKHDKVIAVSKQAAKGWKELTKEDAEVIYNPVKIFKETKPLVIGVFSRLSQEKGSWRYKYLINELKKQNKPFLVFIFTDLPFQEEDKRVIINEPVMNPSGFMEICDYIALLSDTEACPYNVLESLEMGKPLIITKLPVLEELGVNKTNAKILEFDMSNLNIEDLWNIPVVKNWNKPNSKGWEKYMKKKVYREMYREIYGIDVQKEREIMDNLWAKKLKKAAEEIKEEKKNTKKKAGK